MLGFCPEVSENNNYTGQSSADTRVRIRVRNIVLWRRTLTPGSFPNSDTGAHMILNLSSRKQFWIKRKQRKVLANKIKEKILDVDDDGNPRDFRRIRISDARGKITKVDFQLKAIYLIGQQRYLVNIILKSSLRLRLYQKELN